LTLNLNNILENEHAVYLYWCIIYKKVSRHNGATIVRWAMQQCNALTGARNGERVFPVPVRKCSHSTPDGFDSIIDSICLCMLSIMSWSADLFATRTLSLNAAASNSRILWAVLDLTRNSSRNSSSGQKLCEQVWVVKNNVT